MSPISVTKLSKSYESKSGEALALDQVSLEMNKGEILGLLGPNGAGKTTLISILTTIEKQTAGEFRLFGQGPDNLPYKNLFGLVPQETVSYGFFTLDEVLAFISGYHGLRENKKRIDYLLERLNLVEHRHKKVAQLSGGMKKRFGIAKALVHSPPLLLLDEPTAGVDIELRNNLWDFVQELHAQGTSILLTTHYLEEAEKLCDRVSIIDHGKILRTGPTSELVESLTERQVVLRFNREIKDCQSPFLLERKMENNNTSLVFRLPSKMLVGELLSSLSVEASSIADIRIQEGRLEDAFLRVLKAGSGVQK